MAPCRATKAKGWQALLDQINFVKAQGQQDNTDDPDQFHSKYGLFPGRVSPWPVVYFRNWSRFLPMRHRLLQTVLFHRAISRGRAPLSDTGCTPPATQRSVKKSANCRLGRTIRNCLENRKVIGEAREWESPCGRRDGADGSQAPSETETMAGLNRRRSLQRPNRS